MVGLGGAPIVGGLCNGAIVGGCMNRVVILLVEISSRLHPLVL